MEKVHCVVIGAGTVGLAAARALSAAGLSTFVLEQHSHFGEENSSRHSEVIHAGIYYPTDSLKAKFCTEGKKLLLNYVKERSIAHNRCGKVIIASKSKQAALKALLEKGVANGVDDLVMLTKKDMKALEPEVECDMAILSPNTSIVDSHSILLNYVADIENSGHSNIIYYCRVLGIRATELYQSFSGSSCSSSRSRYEVTTSQGTIACDYLVNAGGLHSQFVASQIVNYPSNLIPSSYFAKGNYYKLQRSGNSSASSSSSSSTSSSSSRSSGSDDTRSPFQRLIYPLPSQGGLGIHATLDLSGGVRFGPNVEWIRNPVGESVDVYRFPKNAPPYLNFAVNEDLAAVFYQEIRKYYPAIREGDLVPDYAGIRPKLCGPDNKSPEAGSTTTTGGGEYVMKSAADFLIHTRRTHGWRGLVQLYGIESPGMTSSLAIGEFVRDMLLRDD